MNNFSFGLQIELVAIFVCLSVVEQSKHYFNKVIKMFFNMQTFFKQNKRFSNTTGRVKYLKIVKLTTKNVLPDNGCELQVPIRNV